MEDNGQLMKRNTTSVHLSTGTLTDKRTTSKHSHVTTAYFLSLFPINIFSLNKALLEADMKSVNARIL